MAKSYYKNRPVKANPKFKSKFDEAIFNFSGAFIGSKEFNHSLTKGEQREIPLKIFLMPYTFSYGKLFENWKEIQSRFLM